MFKTVQLEKIKRFRSRKSGRARKTQKKGEKEREKDHKIRKRQKEGTYE